MKQDFREDFIFKKLQENYNVVDEAVTVEHRSVYFSPTDDIVEQTPKIIKVKTRVPGEDGKSAYINLIVPKEYIRTEPKGVRISSKYVRRAIANFNKGLYHGGNIDLSTDYQRQYEYTPSKKINDLDIISKDSDLPLYNKGGFDTKETITQTGVSLNGSPHFKAALTKKDGKPIIVNIPGSEPSFLIGFEMNDEEGIENNTSFRIGSEGNEIIVKSMPIPMADIFPDGRINPEAVQDFIEKWNNGLEYKYDETTRSGSYVERNGNPEELSIEAIKNKLVDLDRYKEKIKFQKDELGNTSPTNLLSVFDQPQRTQIVAAKGPQIDDKTIKDAEKKLGRPFNRKEFLDFIRGKGLISSYSLESPKAFKRWKQQNPRLASYIKSNKKAIKNFVADLGRYETPNEVKTRQEAGMSDVYIIDDESAWVDVPDEIYATESA